MLEHAAREHPGVRFVLKTDDDAYVNVQPLLAFLRGLCASPGCAHESIYAGHFITKAPVVLRPGHKWCAGGVGLRVAVRVLEGFRMPGGPP